MNQRKPTKDERDFIRVVKVGVALAMGLMAAFLISLKQIHPSIRIEITFGSLLAFLITGVLSWMFCGVLFKSELIDGDSPEAAVLRKKRVRRWILIFVGLSVLATAAAFIYSLKDVAAESRRDVMEGTAIAVVVLAVGGFLIYKAVQLFEEQDKVSLEQREHDDDAEP
jgi:hypothetical protein